MILTLIPKRWIVWTIICPRTFSWSLKPHSAATVFLRWIWQTTVSSLSIFYSYQLWLCHLHHVTPFPYCSISRRLRSSCWIRAAINKVSGSVSLSQRTSFSNKRRDCDCPSFQPDRWHIAVNHSRKSHSSSGDALWTPPRLFFSLRGSRP